MVSYNNTDSRPCPVKIFSTVSSCPRTASCERNSWNSTLSVLKIACRGKGRACTQRTPLLQKVGAVELCGLEQSTERFSPTNIHSGYSFIVVFQSAGFTDFAKYTF